ncbi:alpha/beta hydrolase-fold protein [Mariniflexile sp.]|uniref:alpha/beta hydrolase-fold protein n=2 Tax=Mariniflexile sp. TaxID=1979402 RepID=UPI00404750D6
MYNLDLKYRFYKPFWVFALSIAIFGCSSDSSVSEQNPFPKEEEVPFSRLLTNQKFYSTMLGEDVKYAVLLPDGYDTSKDDYPVVYLLHGFGNNEKAWYTDGMIQYYSDQYKGEIAPMIFVMPNAYNTYYVNRYNGRYPFMNMLTIEMVPEIDKLFRTKSDKNNRAVMGYSMGGYGALILPALNPNVFSVGVPLSMSFRTDEQYMAEPQSVYDYQWSPIFGGIGANGQNRITDYFKKHSPFYFFKDQGASNFSNLKLLIDCGDDEESLSVTNDKLHTVLRDLNISHEYRVRNGGHSFDYWKKSYPEALKFISAAFQEMEYPIEPDPAIIGESIKETDYETKNVSGIQINILKNKSYGDSETSKFPVLYFIHDTNARTPVNKLSALSLLNNTMNNLTMPSAIVVEIPSTNDLSSTNIKEIITYVDSNYRTFSQKEKRILMGNSKGGLKVAQFVNEEPSFFNACFLFSANLTENNVSPTPGTFYYLDITDDSEEYTGYNKMYAAIREQNIGYEYRVRQGIDGYQSFLNGLSNSLSNLSKKL